MRTELAGAQSPTRVRAVLNCPLQMLLCLLLVGTNGCIGQPDFAPPDPPDCQGLEADPAALFFGDQLAGEACGGVVLGMPESILYREIEVPRGSIERLRWFDGEQDVTFSLYLAPEPGEEECVLTFDYLCPGTEWRQAALTFTIAEQVHLSWESTWLDQ